MASHKPKRVRSPSYPSVDLGTAIEKLSAMYQFTHRTPVLISVLLPHWGFESGKSANGMKLVAALKSYGLIDAEGQKESRKICITDTGFKILNLPENSTDRSQLIKSIALMPEMYRYVWDTFKELPHFEAIKSHLVIEKKFNASAVKGFLDDYQKTIEYADLAKNDKIDEDIDESEDEGEPGPQTEDGSGQFFGFVPPAPPQTAERKSGIAMKQETFALDNGSILIQWPEELSEESYQDFVDWVDILKRKIKRCVRHNKPDDDKENS